MGTDAAEDAVVEAKEAEVGAFLRERTHRLLVAELRRKNHPPPLQRMMKGRRTIRKRRAQRRKMRKMTMK